MRWWQPADGQPELFDWWRPLLAAARRGRDDRVPWLIQLDEFILVGRVDRKPRPAVWHYRHQAGGYLLADAAGRTYDWAPNRSGRAAGRFKEIRIRHAIWAAGLPEAEDQDPPDPDPDWGDDEWTDEPPDGGVEYEWKPLVERPSLDPPPAKRRRPYLRLVEPPRDVGA